MTLPVARDRERHADDAAFRRGVSGLADLAVLGRDARGVDDRAALAVFHRVERQHPRRRLGDAAERTDEVDLHAPVERIEREMLDATIFLRAARGLDCVAGARAVAEELGRGSGGDRW